MSNQPYYETMYILRPDIPEEEVDSHLTKYSELVTEAGAELLDSQMRGKRRLAYPIAKHKEGIYVQLSHNGDGQHIEILEKAMRLSEDVIRYLTVKQDGPLPTPRAVTSGEQAKEEEDKGNKEEKEAKENKEAKITKEDKANKAKKEDKEDKTTKEDKD